MEERKIVETKKAEQMKNKFQEKRDVPTSTGGDAKTSTETVKSKPTGMSSVGNGLLSSREFDSENALQAVKKQRWVSGRKISVVNTPGWGREQRLSDTPELTRQEIILSVSHCDPGPHVLVLVIRVGIPLQEVRIILLGHRGSGKTAAGSTILGSEAFHTRQSVQSVKKEARPPAPSFSIFNIHAGARQLAEMTCPGRRIFACCRDPSAPKAQSLQELAKKHPGVIHVIRLDTSDPCSVKESAKQVSSALGKSGLNLLVNNAGVLVHGNMQTTGVKEMQDAFNTNIMGRAVPLIMGPMMVTKEFLPYLREAAKSSGKTGMSCGKAAVVNISSALASMATVPETYSLYFPGISYRISKAGLNMLTVCNSVEFKEDGILFTLLHPGWVRTDMGGEGGAIDAQESVGGLLRVMDSLTDKHNGAFLDYNGQPMPW
ncbi:uncharacterized protein LOC143118573 [Alosa pseudoharengus]|uniref:uncharacterized protein LOC143118573 n=1 Tax=Alosa pseudoharengus TaxID=34774 RepID=UPI003F8C1B01